MNLDVLRLFLEVVRQESFAGAAAGRGISASSVSRKISRLEADLGARLLQRSTRRMALTEAGARFHERAQAILDQLDEAAEDARSAEATPRGTLRLTASTAFGERVVTPLVPEFRQAHPRVELDLLFTDANLDLVGEGVDLAIRLAPRLEGDVVATQLLRTRYRVCASPGYLSGRPRIRRPEDLSGHPCIRYTLPGFDGEWRFRSRRRGTRAREARVSVSGPLRSSSALAVRSLALQGSGPALLADWLIREDLADGRLVDLFPSHEVAATDFETSAWLVYPSRSFLPQKTRVMIDFLKSRMT